MSMNDSRAALKRAADQLAGSWARARETWRDEKRQQFEKNYIGPLESNVRKTQIALERMDTILSHVRRDCQ